MKQVAASLTQEEADRLEIVVRAANMTTYRFVHDAVLKEIAVYEDRDPNSKVPSAIVAEMTEALRARKWHLYQMEDYSDKNHKAWLEGRFRKATKTDILDAIAIFRTKASP